MSEMIKESVTSAPVGGRVRHHGYTLPATMSLRTHHGVDRYRGVVVDAHELKSVVTCGHNHVFEDIALTCARRLKAKRLAPDSLAMGHVPITGV